MTARVSTGRGRPRRGYAEISTRPLHVLAFLLPLLVLYEVGSVLWLSEPGFQVRLAAQEYLSTFFDTFGAAGIHLPAFALVVTFVVMHVAHRDPWKIRPGVLAGMAVESVIWTAPLLVFALVLGRAAAAQGSTPHEAVTELSFLGRFTVALGAGLYEETLFRLIGMNVVHGLALKVLKTPDFQAKVLAVVVCAVAFAMLHDLSGLAPGQRVGLRLYFMLAGAYFGLIYLVRGFGVVVGTHATYDLFALLLIADNAGRAG